MSGSLDAAPLAIEGRHGEQDQTMFTVRLVRTAAHWQNVVALSWAAVGQPLKQVEIEKQGAATTFRAGDRAVSLDWSTSPAKLTE
jgi:hypothetical protein